VDDDHVLALLAARLEMSSVEVGALFGRTPEFVRTATNRVRDEDMTQSGEAAEALAPFYQWRVR
jgi:hypothetical protein